MAHAERKSEVREVIIKGDGNCGPVGVIVGFLGVTESLSNPKEFTKRLKRIVGEKNFKKVQDDNSISSLAQYVWTLVKPGTTQTERAELYSSENKLQKKMTEVSQYFRQQVVDTQQTEFSQFDENWQDYKEDKTHVGDAFLNAAGTLLKTKFAVKNSNGLFDVVQWPDDVDPIESVGWYLLFVNNDHFDLIVGTQKVPSSRPEWIVPRSNTSSSRKTRSSSRNSRSPARNSQNSSHSQGGQDNSSHPQGSAGDNSSNSQGSAGDNSSHSQGGAGGNSPPSGGNGSDDYPPHPPPPPTTPPRSKVTAPMDLGLLATSNLLPVPQAWKEVMMDQYRKFRADAETLTFAAVHKALATILFHDENRGGDDQKKKKKKREEEEEEDEETIFESFLNKVLSDAEVSNFPPSGSLSFSLNRTFQLENKEEKKKEEKKQEEKKQKEQNGSNTHSSAVENDRLVSLYFNTNDISSELLSLESSSDSSSDSSDDSSDDSSGAKKKPLNDQNVFPDAPSFRRAYVTFCVFVMLLVHVSRQKRCPVLTLKKMDKVSVEEVSQGQGVQTSMPENSEKTNKGSKAKKETGEHDLFWITVYKNEDFLTLPQVRNFARTAILLAYQLIPSEQGLDVSKVHVDSVFADNFSVGTPDRKKKPRHQIMVIGGRSSKKRKKNQPALSFVERKALYAENGSNGDPWEDMETKPVDLQLHGAGTVVCNEKIYVVGGVNSQNSVQDKVFTYNYFQNRWKELNEKQSPLPEKRAFMGIASVSYIQSPYIFVAGGEDEQGHPQNSVYVFNVIQRKWYTLATKFNLPHRCMGLSLVAYYNPNQTENKKIVLYAIGGKDENNQYLNTIHSLTLTLMPGSKGSGIKPDRDRWKLCFKRMNQARAFAGACLYNPYPKMDEKPTIWIVGGEATEPTDSEDSSQPEAEAEPVPVPLRSVEKFFIDTETVEEGRYLEKGRTRFGICSRGNYLWIIGGLLGKKVTSKLAFFNGFRWINQKKRNKILNKRQYTAAVFLSKNVQNEYGSDTENERKKEAEELQAIDTAKRELHDRNMAGHSGNQASGAGEADQEAGASASLVSNSGHRYNLRFNNRTSQDPSSDTENHESESSGSETEASPPPPPPNLAPPLLPSAPSSDNASADENENARIPNNYEDYLRCKQERKHKNLQIIQRRSKLIKALGRKAMHQISVQPVAYDKSHYSNSKGKSKEDSRRDVNNIEGGYHKVSINPKMQKIEFVHLKFF